MKITQEVWNVLVLVQAMVVLSTSLGTILGITFVEYLRERRKDRVFKKYFLKPRPNKKL